MFIPTRIVDQPIRQFMLWIFEDFVRSRGPIDTALDAACGSLKLSWLVKARRYIAVDQDRELLLSAAKKRANQAELHHSRIEDIDPSLTADFVFCLQCIGVNVDFNNEATVACVERLNSATKPGGTLFFTIGPYAETWQEDAERLTRADFPWPR